MVSGRCLLVVVGSVVGVVLVVVGSITALVPYDK